MFRINSYAENGKSFVVLQNDKKTTTAKICLDEGARLIELKLKNVYLITEQANFDYKTSYASSILFPFVSRLENGKYSFQGENYQFHCNDSGENALHGLVFDKKFELFEPEEHGHCCFATFNYYEKELSEGFPFTYFLSITYTLFEDHLKINVTIKNTDRKAFPFTLGWHPYFNCVDKENSYLSFKSDEKVEFDEKLIGKQVIDCDTLEKFEISNKTLDDCFVLNDNKVIFSSPQYKIEMTQSGKNNFLQLYTPGNLPLIAIEPMTGISNSFNNKIGLQVLESQSTYAIYWSLRLMN